MSLIDLPKRPSRIRRSDEAQPRFLPFDTLPTDQRGLSVRRLQFTTASRTQDQGHRSRAQRSLGSTQGLLLEFCKCPWNAVLEAANRKPHQPGRMEASRAGALTIALC